MSRLFDHYDVNAIEKIEREILDNLRKLFFHKANHSVFENVSQYFKDNNLVLKFSNDFLNTVYDKLIGPARTYGYYFGNMPESERPTLFRTSSASQYSGNDDRFRNACCIILGTIDSERQKRNAPAYSHCVS